MFVGTGYSLPFISNSSIYTGIDFCDLGIRICIVGNYIKSGQDGTPYIKLKTLRLLLTYFLAEIGIAHTGDLMVLNDTVYR